MLGSNPSAESMPKASATGVEVQTPHSAPANCLWLQCDKSRGFGGRATKDAQQRFVHQFTKLNLANVYATYAEPKQVTRPIGVAEAMSRCLLHIVR